MGTKIGQTFSNSTVDHTTLEDTVAFISAKAGVVPLVAMALQASTLVLQ